LRHIGHKFPAIQGCAIGAVQIHNLPAVAAALQAGMAAGDGILRQGNIVAGQTADSKGIGRKRQHTLITKTSYM
jgi:hypothetical protein